MKTPDKSREIDRAADACLLALSGDAAGTFIRNGFLRHSKTHPYMRLPPLPPEERAEYERGPSPWPAVLLITATMVVWALVICTAV